MPGEDRAISEVIGYVLVFALVLSSVTIVSVGFIDSLETRSDAEAVDNAEAGFDVLASNVREVYSGAAPSRATELSLGRASLSTRENVTAEVRLVDTTGATDTFWPGPAATDWKSWRYRPLVYESPAGAKIVYEAGAVFRISANAVSPDSVASADQRASIRKRDPPVTVRGGPDNEQVLVPIVHLNSSVPEHMSGATVLIRTGEEEASLGAVEERGTDYEKVKVRLSNTPRYLEWAAYFENEAGFDSCSTTPADDRVTCTYEGSGAGNTIEVVVVAAHEIPVSLDP